MHLTRRVSLFLLVFVLVGLFASGLSFAATHIVGPEDNSVYIDQRDPDENKSYKSGILTASAINENARIVIHFDLSGWGPDSISQAKLYLYHYRGGDYTGFRTINAYSLTAGFDEATATWNFPWTNAGGDYDASLGTSANVPEELENWVEWDVTDLLKERWSNVADYGFLLKDPVEDSPTDGPYVRFRSHRYLSEFPQELPYLEILTEPTDVEFTDDENTFRVFSLGQNFPNPFNSKTLIEFKLSRPASVNLTIYNVQGQKVKTILDARRRAGTHVIEWDATDQYGKPVASGMYLYRLQARDFSQTKPLLYLK